MDPYLVLGSAVVGLLVGLTGSGGGALMTPMLVLLFSVKPSTAISSDLVASLVMRPVGAAVHAGRRTIDWRLVQWMSAGSVPAAFAGTYLLHVLGHTNAAEREVERALGAALLLGAAAMIVRRLLDDRFGKGRHRGERDLGVKPLPTLAIGIVGGLVVGLTSVGAGSLMVVLLMFLYPTLGAGELVGTDLAQAVPLTAAAGLGATLFGHVAVPVTASIVAGSVPAVLVGSLASSRVHDGYLRPVVTLVILASGLKYAGVATRQLEVLLVPMLVVLAGVLAARARANRRQPDLDVARR